MIIPYKQCCEIIHSIYKTHPKKVLHIGGHHGEEASDYQNNGVEEVIWVEANQSLISTLQQSTSRFSMKQQILELALWNKDETLKFNINSNSQSSSILDLGTHLSWYPEYTVAQQIDMPAHRLDTIINNKTHNLIFEDFEFINIDTQGSELAILEGFGEYLNSSSIKALYLEVNLEELYKGGPLLADLDQYLIQYGYVRILTGVGNHQWGDALWIRPVSFVA
jgi:FkbM family methyltransferase